MPIIVVTSITSLPSTTDAEGVLAQNEAGVLASTVTVNDDDGDTDSSFNDDEEFHDCFERVEEHTVSVQQVANLGYKQLLQTGPLWDDTYHDTLEEAEDIQAQQACEDDFMQSAEMDWYRAKSEASA